MVRESIEENRHVSARRLALHALCPYFAMFPENFVREQVEAYSDKGDWVFVPFCGRGSTVLESLLLGRNAAGSDVSPVAFCVSRAKAQRPSLGAVHTRLDRLEESYGNTGTDRWEQERLSLPPFFKRAFYPTTLRSLLFLRSSLCWRANRTDGFIAALILGSLHGEMDRSSAYFSNQMPRTICLKPEYSLRYWKKKRLFPKKREVFRMLRGKALYRLKALPRCGSGRVIQADAREAFSRFRALRGKVSLIVTSPPYLNVTCCEEDQWLRLWFLGGEPRPTYGMVSKDDRHVTPARYWRFLSESWAGIALLMKPSGKIVIRLGSLGADEEDLTSHLSLSIKGVFPGARLIADPRRSELVGRQTRSFSRAGGGCRYETDYVFQLQRY